MRILFLHEVGYLEKPIFEMHEFPEHLSSRGHEIAFADFPEKLGSNFKGTKGALVGGRVLVHAKIKLYSQTSLAPGILGRLLAAGLFPVFWYRVLRDFKPDLVVSFAVPTSGWQAALICRSKGIPFIFRALDVSHKIRKTVFASLVKVAERVVYSSASWVSCNNQAMRDYCLSLGANYQKSSVDYPPLDLSHFLDAEISTDVLRRHGIPDKRQVIVYMGSFFYFSGLETVIRQLSLLKERPHLVLIGGGEQESELRKITKVLKLEQFVTFTGFVSYKDLPSYLSIGDVAINPMVPSLVSHKALPNKVLQYMASALPVVTTKLEGLISVFPGSDGIRLVDDSTSVLPAAIEMLEKPNLIELGESNRTVVARKFNAGIATHEFEQRLLTVGLGK